MYMIREVLHCSPGNVREMVRKFQALGEVMKRMAVEPFRIYTDVSGERFWTLVLESDHESLDAFGEVEEAVMSSPEGKAAMAGYHDLVVDGRREIYKVES